MFNEPSVLGKGGQGWDYTRNRSVNAVNDEANGFFPLAEAAKAAGLTKAIMQEFGEVACWHHVGKNHKRTQYFSVAQACEAVESGECVLTPAQMRKYKQANYLVNSAKQAKAARNQKLEEVRAKIEADKKRGFRLF